MIIETLKLKRIISGVVGIIGCDGNRRLVHIRRSQIIEALGIRDMTASREDTVSMSRMPRREAGISRKAGTQMTSDG